MKHKVFPKPTLPRVLGMKKKSLHGITYALQNSGIEDDYTGMTLDVTILLLEYIASNMNECDTIADVIKTNEANVSAIYDTDIIVLGLSCRSFNCLKRAGLNTIGDIAELSESELRNIRNFGKKSFNEVVSALSKCGVILNCKGG